MGLPSTRTASGAAPSSCCRIPISGSEQLARDLAALRRAAAENRRAARDRRQIRRLPVPPGRRHRGLSPRRKPGVAGRPRLCRAARALQRGAAEAAVGAAAHHRPGRPHGRHHAGGADAAGGASQAARARRQAVRAEMTRPTRRSQFRLSSPRKRGSIFRAGEWVPASRGRTGPISPIHDRSRAPLPSSPPIAPAP